MKSFHAPSVEEISGLFPGYDFDCLIASGGMGAVYKAKQIALDRDVAIKILPEELGEDAMFIHCFEQEAKAMAKLNHPNLINVYDFGKIQHIFFLVEEYVNGKSLYHETYQQLFDQELSVKIILDICRGMQHAHEHDIVHRDLKPANILLNEKQYAKIADFGLASDLNVSNQGLAMGTPGYIAPEVKKNPRGADKRSDIYAIGMILYELLTGRLPDEQKPTRPSELAGTDPGLDIIWEKATHADLDLRYADLTLMIRDLESWEFNYGSSLTLQYKDPKLIHNQSIKKAKSALSAHPPTAHPISTKIASKKITRSIPPASGSIISNPHHSSAKNKKSKRLALCAMLFLGLSLVGGLFYYKKQNDSNAKPHETLSLEEKIQLYVEGDRTHPLPSKSWKSHQHVFAVIEKPMSWQEAKQYAESLKGSLAMPKNIESLRLLQQRIIIERYAWLGIYKNTSNQWVYANNEPVHIDFSIKEKGMCVAIESSGLLHSLSGEAKYPFVVQWNLK